MSGFLPTPIPAVGTVGGVARNEPIYDSEGLAAAGAAVPATPIRTFVNYGQFATAGLPNVKQPGRDTNLSGAASGLPQGHQHFAVAWTQEVHAMDANLSLAANVVVFEQIHRYRRMGSTTLQINNNNAYITVRNVELLGFEDSLNVFTTHGAATVIAADVGDRKGKSLMSIQRFKTAQGITPPKNSPYVLQPLQIFSCNTTVPGTATALTLQVALYKVDKFSGVLVRGIS
jgi:hypothetical protein